MSTRSTTHFIHGDPKKPVAIIYRHSDGYPEGAGKDILRFIAECGSLKDPRFGDASYLAAKYVVFLAGEFNNHWVSDRTTAGGHYEPNASKLDFLSVGIVSTDPGDIEYRYVIDCNGADRNLPPSVKCFEVSETWDIEKQRDKPMSKWALNETPIPEA